jgi:hypothetical protein
MPARTYHAMGHPRWRAMTSPARSNSSRQRFSFAFLEAAKWMATSLRSPRSMIGKFRCGRFAHAGGDATPIKLLVLVAGKFAVATESRGERPNAGAVK